MPRARPAVVTQATSRSAVNSFSTGSMSTVEERLAAAERELKVQFARIAQLQAQLDRVAAVFRAVPTDPHHSECSREAL